MMMFEFSIVNGEFEVRMRSIVASSSSLITLTHFKTLHWYRSKINQINQLGGYGLCIYQEERSEIQNIVEVAG